MFSLSSSPDESLSPRQRIVATARRHFFAHGLRTVTMDDLAAELGMSKKTLYANFPSKDLLLKEVLHSKMDSVEGDLANLSTQFRGDSKAELEAMLFCIQGHTEELQPSFLRDLQRDAPEMFSVIEGRRKDVIHKFFGKLLNEGRREGVFRKDIPPKLFVEILLAAVQALMNPKKVSELGVPPRVVFETIMTVIFEGALEKRRKS